LLEDGLQKSRTTRSWPEGDLSFRAPTNATFRDGEIGRFDLGGGTKVHVFAALHEGTPPAGQLEIVEAAIADAAKDGSSVDGPADLVAVPGGGTDVRFQTTSKRGGETVRALRQVHFRAKRTYCVMCYAKDAEFSTKRGLFTKLLDSVRVDE